MVCLARSVSRSNVVRRSDRHAVRQVTVRGVFVIFPREPHGSTIDTGSRLPITQNGTPPHRAHDRRAIDRRLAVGPKAHSRAEQTARAAHPDTQPFGLPVYGGASGPRRAQTSLSASDPERFTDARPGA